MKRIGAGLIVLLLAGAGIAAAQGREAAAGPRGRGNGPRVRQRPGQRWANLMEELNLSEEQAAHVRQILQTHHQAQQNWRREHGEEFRAAREALRKARQERDAEAVQAARKQFKELRAAREGSRKDLLQQLDDVLNDEQMAKMKRFLRAGRGRPMSGQHLAGLDLSDEQKAQAKEILQAARKQAAEAEGEEAKKEILQAARKRIAEDVLTEEQRAKAAARREGRGSGRDGPFRGLELTEEQQGQVKEIIQAARKEAAQAEGREAKREIFRAAHTKIAEEVLTDAQRKQMAERRRTGRRARVGGALRQLDLTEAQQEKVRAILQEARAKAQAAEGRAEKAEIAKAARAKVAEVLTDEQREKLEQMRQQRRETMRQGRGAGGGRRRGPGGRGRAQANE